MKKRSQAARERGRHDTACRITTDHEEIREWAELRGAWPAQLRGSGKHGATGVLRLDFPDHSGEGRLEEISWEEFFEKFDNADLAFLYQPETKSGERSNFNKIVKLDQVEDIDSD